MNEKIAGIGAEEVVELAKMFMSEKDNIKALIEEFRPVVSEALILAMDTVGPEIERVVVRVALGTVSIRKAVMEQYVADGFSRDEAMCFMLNDNTNTKKAGQVVGDVVKASGSAKSKTKTK